jgi:hypothetical protein
MQDPRSRKLVLKLAQCRPSNLKVGFKRKTQNASKYSRDSSYNLLFTLEHGFVKEIISLKLGNKSF